MTGFKLLCKLDNKMDNISNKSDNAYKNNVYADLILSDIPKEVDITRKQAAIIVHEYLKRVLHETDVDDVSAAAVLKDLYDCRICVRHIEQLYVKGIIEPQITVEMARSTGLPVIFGGNELLTDDEADKIVKRIFDKKERLIIQ